MVENLVFIYIRGRVCFVGDVVYVIGFYFGVGGGFGIEDVYFLVILLSYFNDMLGMGFILVKDECVIVEVVLKGYNDVCFDRI